MMTHCISISAIEDQVIAAMLAAGITPPQEGLFLDAHLQRFHIEGDKPGSKNGAYCIYPQGKSYNGWPNGFFQDHKRGGDVEKWQYRPTEAEHALLAERKKLASSPEVAAKRVADERLSAEQTKKAREQALRTYERVSVAQPDHPYLVRKNVGVYGDLRQSEEGLVVPLRDVTDDSFVTYQRIRPDGNKKFVSPLGSGSVAFTIAGDVAQGPVLVCEGLATGLTLYEASSHTTVCAMTCGNLVKIAVALRAKYPGRKIFVAADDDAVTKRKSGYNPGLDCAKKAVQVGLDGILRPPFLPEDEKEDPTDWNDYARLHGPDVTVRVLRGQIEKASLSPAEQKHLAEMQKIHQRTRLVNAADLMEKELPPIRWALPNIIAAALCVLIGRPKIGKSSLTLGIAVAIATGGVALGRIGTERGNVLYLALEDTERRLQQRIRAMGYGGTDLSRIDIVFEIPRQHEGGLTFVEEWLKGHPDARLIVVDTLQKFRKPRTPNANAYEDDYETLASVKQIADRHDVAVLFLHHEKKSRDAEDFINNASGSAAVTGSADCLLFLNRARLQGLGKLIITGRDVEEREYALSLAGMEWRLEGDAREYEMATEKLAILDYLKENGETAPKDLADAMEVKPNTMRQKLLRMSKEGLVYSNNGRYGLSGSTLPLANMPESSKQHELLQCPEDMPM